MNDLAMTQILSQLANQALEQSDECILAYSYNEERLDETLDTNNIEDPNVTRLNTSLQILSENKNSGVVAMRKQSSNVQAYTVLDDEGVLYRLEFGFDILTDAVSLFGASYDDADLTYEKFASLINLLTRRMIEVHMT